jgi:GDP-L-fucose synthase
MVEKSSPILVTGHRGLVGSAIVRKLHAGGFTNLITASRKEVDLRDQAAVDTWFDETKPAFIYHVAGLVGGIQANATRPAEFLYDNILIHATVLHSAWQCGARKLLYLGSSCIYPRDCPQPIREEYLLTGPLEKTNQAYAIAKISGLLSCQAYREQYGCDFISAMPTNLYGPGDNFDLVGSHVLPALLRKFHEAKLDGQPDVVVWGSGAPKREFLHVDDLADACTFLMDHYSEPTTMNVGTGEDLSIRELAECIRQVVYPEAKLVFDTEKPDGTPRKLLDVRRLHELGWRHQIALPHGIESTYAWFLNNSAEIRS